MDILIKVVGFILLTAVGLSGCSTDKSDTSNDVFSSLTVQGIKVSDKYRVFGSTPEYLDRVDLDSFYFADADGHIELALFSKLIESLFSQEQSSIFPSAPHYLNLFTDHPASDEINLSQKNINGFSASAYSETGVHHFFFKREGKSYKRISKLDSQTHEGLSLRDATLLHFASFKEAPRSSGIVTLHRSLTTEQLTAADSWSQRKINTKLIDGVYSDSALNIGVVYLDDHPDGGSSCGGRCTEAITVSSTCKVGLDGQTYRCEPVGDDGGGGCFGHSTVKFTLSNDLETEIDLPKFRQFDNEYLSKTALGQRYLTYIPVLDAHLKLDLASVAIYSNIFPDLYRMMDTLMDPDIPDETVVIDEVLYQKAIDILAKYDSVKDEDFRSMSERMQADLASARGLSKSELEEWIRHQ